MEKDVPALAAISVLSAQYPRFGYRRIHVFMDRQGLEMGHGRVWRLWRKGGFQVPKKRPRKRPAGSRPRPQIPKGRGQVWAYDFVHDVARPGAAGVCQPPRQAVEDVAQGWPPDHAGKGLPTDQYLHGQSIPLQLPPVRTASPNTRAPLSRLSASRQSGPAASESARRVSTSSMATWTLPMASSIASRG